MYGNYEQENPPARIVDAVKSGEVDLAIVWGPLAGYFAGDELVLQNVTPELDPPYLPFVYDIAVGIRRGEEELRLKIDEILLRRRDDIEKILNEYRVPLVGAKQAEVRSRGDRNFTDRRPAPAEELGSLQSRQSFHLRTREASR